MSAIQLYKGSRRNTQCYIIHAVGMTLYFSYETVIGIACPKGNFRRRNSWGPTTGRHMNDMDIRRYQEVSESELDALINESIDMYLEGRIEQIKHRMQARDAAAT